MERYRAMLLARSGEERVKMGFSMNATARALIRASVMAKLTLDLGPGEAEAIALAAEMSDALLVMDEPMDAASLAVWGFE